MTRLGVLNRGLTVNSVGAMNLCIMKTHARRPLAVAGVCIGGVGMVLIRMKAARLGVAKGKLSVAVAGDEVARSRRRDADQPWRRWYKTAQWQRLRWSVLMAGLFRCARCGQVEADTSQLVADHVVAHRGDETMFWDAGNLQCLCKGCHDGAKQAEERRGG